MGDRRRKVRRSWMEMDWIGKESRRGKERMGWSEKEWRRVEWSM